MHLDKHHDHLEFVGKVEEMLRGYCRQDHTLNYQENYGIIQMIECLLHRLRKEKDIMWMANEYQKEEKTQFISNDKAKN